MRSGYVGAVGAWVIAGLVVGCSSRGAGAVEPYIDGQFVCVDATATAAAGAQQPPADAPSGCRTWPANALDLVREESMCGPCGFELDVAKTRVEREDHPTVCCYRVSSPPPPG